jgi:DNA (cytosine-5)-methyltransferase 3A
MGGKKLLIGGSPCTHWSIAQTKNRETEASGIGWELFLNYRIARDKYQPDFFLYENNKSMSPAIRAQITAELGVEPVLINSALVSAQNRQRLYWAGKRNPDGTYSQVTVEQPEDWGMLLRDILETGTAWKEKAYTLRASHGPHGGLSSVIKTIKEPGKFTFNGAAEPVRIGQNEKGELTQCQSKRIYSVDAKGRVLNAGPGGLGVQTGLYAVPIRCGDMPNAAGEILGGQAHRIYDSAGKAVTLTARPNGGGVDGPLPVYEVRDGRITIKGKQYPIKLADGFYIIRKLTVTECKRLQTVPDTYAFPVSDTQAYKMLGNGWTVDVIAHIMSHFDGLDSGPVEVLSMYDGMSCGHIALDKLGAAVSGYYATEIDKYAIQTTQHNYPETIQLGDAFQVREEGWTPYGRQESMVVDGGHRRGGADWRTVHPDGKAQRGSESGNRAGKGNYTTRAGISRDSGVFGPGMGRGRAAGQRRARAGGHRHLRQGRAGQDGLGRGPGMQPEGASRLCMGGAQPGGRSPMAGEHPRGAHPKGPVCRV